MKAAKLAVRGSNVVNALKKRSLNDSLAAVHCPPAFKKLLFSESYSDVVFITNSNERIFAHKCVLATASTSMEAMVMGPWLENLYQTGTASVPVSQVEVPLSSSTMKAFLEFIYTGVFDTSIHIFSANLMELFDVATLYEVPEFAQKIDTVGIEVLHPISQLSKADTVAAITLAAYFHNRQNLKEVCVEYVKKQGKPLIGQ